MLAIGAVRYIKSETSHFAVWNDFAKVFRGLSTLNRDELLPLPGTAEELKTIRGLFGDKVTTMSGYEATESEFKRMVGARQFNVIHLAVHAFSDRNYPDRAGMLFAPESKAGETEGNDGILQLPEIRSLPLERTTLVTLSACNTNVGRTEGEEGLSSIVQSFLYAGAKSAVATLWMTEDMSTSDLMKRFYKHLATGESTRDALRHSQLEMIHGGGDRGSPLYWVAFALNGDGARTVP
jgi:CHAT domain-containing protein